VAVGGESSDVDAVKLACELLVSQKGSLYIVYVIEVERGLPVDAEIAPATAKGEEVLTHMEAVAKELRFEAVAELLQSRRSGLAVVQEAVEKQVDAIVIGIPYREVYGAFSLGETAPYVLEHAPCRVILWRDQIPATALDDGRRP
jgi:nucleotide-binding universal stress UspA family protein